MASKTLTFANPTGVVLILAGVLLALFIISKSETLQELAKGELPV